MKHRSNAVLVIVVAVAGLMPTASSGQDRLPNGAETTSAWTPPRTPDGRPDLQGYWTTQTFTPLERPEYLGDKAFFTEEEAASLHQQLTAEGVDPLARSAITVEDADAREELLRQTNRDATYVHYDNSVWLRTPDPKGISTRRTSLITSPASGRIPGRTPEAKQRAADDDDLRNGRGPFDGYETRPLSERCITWPHNGPPMLPPAYNDIHQIFQTPEHLVVYTELSNNAPRIIPLDDRPPLPDRIRLYPGDSRGRWEGDTLVVESRNFTDRTRFQGSSDSLHVVERFTRISEDTILYEFTVDDPSTWPEPWSVELPMVKTQGPMFEFACHEGNYDLRHILEIYRNLDARPEP